MDITNQTDPEVRQRWYAIGLYLQYNAVYGPAGTWVSEMGRNKYLQSIYEACDEVGGTVYTMCVGWYNSNIDFYAPTSREMVANILHL